MAGNDTESLFLTLGLDINELETGFVAADRTVRENLARLNRESNLIKLRAEVEIGNLDETADAAQILTIRETALNQQMEIQRDRIRLAEAALSDLIQRHGEEAVVTQRAETALERERLSLQRLERELREVNQAQNDFNNTQQETPTDSGLSSLSETLQNLPVEKFAAIGAGIAAIGTVADTAANSTKELIERFRELQNQAYELNMPFDKTKDFLRQLKLGGGDIGDFEGYIRGITDAYVKGEFDDPEFIALEKYGAKIVDATGKLKDFKDITEEVYQAWKQADAAGEGIEFLQLTGGEAGIRDAIQFFKRYEEAKEDAEKVFNSGVDPAELHEAERALNLLTEQTAEFKDAAADLIMPFAIDTTKELFELFHSGTEYLVENKDEFQRWGFIATEALSTVLQPLKILKDGFEELDKPGDNLFFDSLKKSAKNTSENFILGAPFKFLNDFGFFDGIIDRAEKKQKEYNAAAQKTAESQKKLNEEMEKADSGSTLNQYDTKRITAFRDELEDLEIESDFGDDPYAKALAENDLWLERELTRKNFLSNDEKTALLELHAAKTIQIEEEEKARIAEINEKFAEQINSVYQTELEKRIAQIEKEKQAWIQKGVDEVKATQLAEQQKADAKRNAAMSVLKQEYEEYKVYQEEGYGGLVNYQKSKLAEAGIDLSDLNMTPQQLQNYQKAKQVAENSLLPNFMTPADKAARDSMLHKGYVDLQQLQNYPPQINTQVPLDNSVQNQPNQNYYNPNQDYNNQNTGLETDTTDFAQKLTDLSLVIENINLTLEDSLNEELEYSAQALADFSTAVEDISFESLNEQMASVTETLSGFGAAIENISLLADKLNEQYYSDSGSNAQQITNNVTVQIEEAHAWDSEHIQELTDKVADKITPAIEQALGGNNNAY